MFPTILINFREYLPVSQAPNARLARWRAVRIGDSVCLFGWNCDRKCWRSSTSIKAICADTLSLVTKSGRIYRLVGAPGRDAEVGAYLAVWLDACGVDPATVADATEDLAVMFRADVASRA